MSVSEAKNIYGWEQGPVLPLDAQRAYFQFMTHLTKTVKTGEKWPVETFAEFGNGTSFAVGICALLSGADRYLAFDFLPLVDMAKQPALVEQLRSMFAAREPARNDLGKVAIDFPREIVTDAILARTLAADPLTRIEYVAPYAGRLPAYRGAVDMLVSTATMEHVDDAEALYADFRLLLRPGGVMSHSIDMRNHGYSKERNGKTLWNSHWLLSDREWAEVTAGQSFSINRLPASSHIRFIVEHGFKLLAVQKRRFENELKYYELASRFQWMTAEDIECSGLHVISAKIG